MCKVYEVFKRVFALGACHKNLLFTFFYHSIIPFVLSSDATPPKLEVSLYAVDSFSEEHLAHATNVGVKLVRHGFLRVSATLARKARGGSKPNRRCVCVHVYYEPTLLIVQFCFQQQFSFSFFHCSYWSTACAVVATRLYLAWPPPMRPFTNLRYASNSNVNNIYIYLSEFLFFLNGAYCTDFNLQVAQDLAHKEHLRLWAYGHPGDSDDEDEPAVVTAPAGKKDEEKK